ncbi:long-chain-fatty-acid--CoA ligase 3-like [Centruroides sculpturatus]|uniref:long-chain-fatty-acid--CoA ligase 3-like n=1 Tax=Centruroides sculpturatus TaxID=218467 RepID=UPI000C6CEDA5|nr:long-chain-fatty-acid--CoA ligase 3-like [Centruroides sculpturatus]
MDVEDDLPGRVGTPLSSCYIKLVNWEEGNYHVTDKPNPRGEIVVGGDCVSAGYYKNEAMTKEYYREEDGIRWFYTGDIGEVFPDGAIKIIGINFLKIIHYRKKDLLKLQFGEYISLGKVETELKTCPLVDNICVYGNSFQTYLVALVVPNKRQLRTLAKELGKEQLNFNELCQDYAITSAVEKAVKEYGIKCRLQKVEIPTKIKLCKEEWHPDTGLVTAAFKLRRNIIQQFYQRYIDEMYGSEINGQSKST